MTRSSRDEILGPGINELAEALFKTPFICNSDKYLSHPEHEIPPCRTEKHDAEGIQDGA
ncbi:MAG: hypothetical protein MZV63_02085 [Marinilabiliales bacterium]|nr:hypothetical protein [Marinilabiliales bacterium]